MRTRSSIIDAGFTSVAASGTRPATHYGSSTTVSTTSGSTPALGPIQTSGSESYITDQYGRIGSAKAVNHVKLAWSCTPNTTFYHPGGGIALAKGSGYTKITGTAGAFYCLSRVNGMMDNARIRHGTWILPGHSIAFAPEYLDNQNVQALYERAGKPVADMLLNLVEANQVVPSFKSLADFHEKKGEYTWKSFVNAHKRALKSGAGKYLAYSFGVAPLISDAVKLHSWLSKAKADYERYSAAQPKSISITRMGSASFLDWTDYGPDGTHDKRVFDGFCTQSPVTKYVLRYREKVPYQSEFFRRANWLLRRLGSSPAALAWEKVPYSFVVDWFLDVGGLIAWTDRLIGQDPLETISLTRSDHLEAVTRCRVRIENAHNGVVVYEGYEGEITHKLYKRQPLIRRPYIGLAGRFGKKQASLSVALLLQKIL